MVEVEAKAGVDGEVGEPTIKVTEAPLEDSSAPDEVATDEAGAGERRAKPSVETRRGAEPTAADLHPTAEARALEGQPW